MKLGLLIAGAVLLFAAPLLAQNATQKPAWKSGLIVLYSYDAGTKTLPPIEYNDLSVDVTDPRRTEQRQIIARDDLVRIQIRTEDGLYYINQNLKYIWQAKLNIKQGDTVEVLAKDGRIRIRTNTGKKAKYQYMLFVPKEFETNT